MVGPVIQLRKRRALTRHGMFLPRAFDPRGRVFEFLKYPKVLVSL